MGISHIVHVVSMDDVIINFGERVFQSRDVRGAVCSGVLELDSSARGVSLAGGGVFVFAEALRFMVLDCG